MSTIATIDVPTRDQVNRTNQTLFDGLVKALGFVPNLYATFAHSETALQTYLTLQKTKSSLDAKAREVVNLAVSEVNGCAYCLAAHTVLGKMQGFADEQIMEIRSGRAGFDAKLDALARLTRGIVEERGHADPALVQAFLEAGWTKGNLVDVIIAIGDKIISNYLHGVTRIAVDFPAAAPLPLSTDHPEKSRRLSRAEPSL